MKIIVLVFCAALLMILVEILRPGRKWPTVSKWWLRAAVFNGFQIGSVFVSGYLWDRVLTGYSLFNLSDYNNNLQAIIGYLVITFIYYWWHRWRHQVDFLWRWFHQLHHSPQRIEIITSFYKHPAEILVNGFLSSFILYVLVGVSLEAGAIAVLLTGFGELFYHWNVKTPYWIGFFFQRPESHCVHHQKGVHKYNYSDLPLWDIMFGTFKNPKEFTAECGFTTEKELKIADMLRGKHLFKKP